MRPLRSWVPQTLQDKATFVVCVIAVLIASTAFVLSFTPLLNKQIDIMLFRLQMLGGIFVSPLPIIACVFGKIERIKRGINSHAANHQNRRPAYHGTALLFVWPHGW